MAYALYMIQTSGLKIRQWSASIDLDWIVSSALLVYEYIIFIF